MIKFITDTRAGEMPFENSVFQQDLWITDLEGSLISIFDAPVKGWSHDLLQRLAFDIDNDSRLSKVQLGADAYLGKTWVGSTEV